MPHQYLMWQLYSCNQLCIWCRKLCLVPGSCICEILKHTNSSILLIGVGYNTFHLPPDMTAFTTIPHLYLDEITLLWTRSPHLWGLSKHLEYKTERWKRFFEARKPFQIYLFPGLYIYTYVDKLTRLMTFIIEHNELKNMFWCTTRRLGQGYV